MSYHCFTLSRCCAIHCLYLQADFHKRVFKRAKGNAMTINTAMSRNEVAAFVVRLRMQKYKVNEFQHGYSVEVDGAQLFRACDMGNERYHVRYNVNVFPDV